MIEKTLVWQGKDSAKLEDFKDVDILKVEAESEYYPSLFRFLTLLKRLNNIELILTKEMEQLAYLTGFDNLLNNHE